MFIGPLKQIKLEHDVLDKYEIAKGVINEEVIDFRSEKKYDLESGNEWKEALWEDVQDAKYSTPFPFANGLVIGIIAVKPEVEISTQYRLVIQNLVSTAENAQLDSY